MNRKTLRTKFEPRNPQKYRGDPTNIICRSSWELYFCHFLDNSPLIERWGSEELAIPYLSPKDGREHRYFVDFLVKYTNGTIVLFEIKPDAQTKPPKQPTKKTQKAMVRFNDELLTFGVNQAKWNAAHRFAKQNGAHFMIFTENHLKQLGMPVQ